MYLAIDKLQYIEGSGKTQMAHVLGKDAPMELHKSMQELEKELRQKLLIRGKHKVTLTPEGMILRAFCGFTRDTCSITASSGASETMKSL